MAFAGDAFRMGLMSHVGFHCVRREIETEQSVGKTRSVQ
jgi:hypothetical protein